jgi:thymidylate kinase
MAQGDSVRDLDKILARLYSNEEGARRVVEHAGIPVEFVKFAGNPINMWFGIITEARKRQLIGTLVDVALKDYAKDSDLIRAKSALTPDAPGMSDQAFVAPHQLPDRPTYIARYKTLISESTREIVLCTNKLHKSKDRAEAKEINKALHEARLRGVDVQILVADGYDRLPGAIELDRDLDIAVRFDPGIHISDINYTCFDRRQSLVAARAPAYGETNYEPSQAWIEFSSEALAATLMDDFWRRWSSPATKTLGQYLRESLPAIASATSAAVVARDLSMRQEEIERYLKPSPPKLFLVGRPGSGKTSVAKAIQQMVERTGARGPVVWLSDVTYLWGLFGQSGRKDERFEAMSDGGFFVKDDRLFRDALEDLAERATRDGGRAGLLLLEFSRAKYIEALDVLKGKGIEPDLVVYLNVEFKVALMRNRQRAEMGRGVEHYVSEQEMKLTYATDDLEELRRALGGRLLVLTEQGEPVEAVRHNAVQILERLKTASRQPRSIA